MQETFFLNFKTRGTQRSEVVVALGANENCVVETHRINEHLSNWPCIVTFETVVCYAAKPVCYLYMEKEVPVLL